MYQVDFDFFFFLLRHSTNNQSSFNIYRSTNKAEKYDWWVYVNGYYHLFFSRLKIFSLLVILFSLFACGTSDFFFIPLPNDLIFYARYSVYTALLRLPLLFFHYFHWVPLLKIYIFCVCTHFASCFVRFVVVHGAGLQWILNIIGENLQHTHKESFGLLKIYLQ